MYAQSVVTELQNRGRGDIRFVDCPVSGGALRAASGTLSIMAGASDEALAAARDILQEMSDENKLYLVPGGVGAGSNMKMVHQVLAAIHILGASEAQGFAAQLGLDARATAEKIQSSGAWTWMHENRFPRMVDEDWNPGVSALTIILKDAVRSHLPALCILLSRGRESLISLQGIITTTARQQRFPSPLCSTAEQTYLSALLHGWGPKDDSAMVRQYYAKPLSDVTPCTDAEAATELVLDYMRGVNLVAAAEAVAFARYLNVDLSMFHALVSQAAGASKIFIEQGLEMIEGRIGDQAPAGSPTVDQVATKLEAAVQKARDLHCPLHLGNEALNLLFMAQRHGWGNQSSTSVIRVYGQ
jgi:3-hydroxyisobutyrate dehydrogenase